MAENPLDQIAAEHRLQERLCDALETIADSIAAAMPEGRVDPALVQGVLIPLRDDIAAHNRIEQDMLFSLLEKRARPGDDMAELLAGLALEQATDECFVDEILGGLETLARGERVPNPATLAAQIRCCIENQRRHLAWEARVLLPLARERLTTEDLDTLARYMLKKGDEARQ